MWFIRHAESLGNTGQFGGPDPRLSERGKQQAGQIKGPVELLIVSPMKRCLETYLHSHLSSQKLLMSDLFRERMHSGKGEYRDGEEDKAESDARFEKRLETALEFLRAQPETRIGILSHSMFLAAFTKKLYGQPIYFANGQVVHRTLE